MAEIIATVRKGFGVANKALLLVSILFAFNLIGNLASLPFAVTPGVTPTPQLTASALGFTIIFILISIFFQGATLGLVRDAVKGGRMALGKFASYGLKYYLRLFCLGLLIILIATVVALVVGLMIAATAPLNNTVLTGIVVAIAVVIAAAAALFYFIPLTLSPYALVCDELGIIEAMKRSLKIAKTPFSRVFLLLLLLIVLVLIAIGIGFVFGFLIGLVSAVLPAGIGQILMSIVMSAVNSYVGIVATASFTIFYLALAGEKKSTAEKIF